MLFTALFDLTLESVVREVRNNKKIDVIGKNTWLAYANDIVFFGEYKSDLILSTIGIGEKIFKKLDFK